MTEFELVDHAVRAMRREGVGVTPARVEVAVNAARGREVRREYLTPRRPDGSGGVVRNVRVASGQARQFAETVPYFRLGAARRAELEAEAEALKAKIQAPGLDLVLRDKLRQDLRKIADELAMDRGSPPERSSSKPGLGYDRPTKG